MSGFEYGVFKRPSGGFLAIGELRREGKPTVLIDARGATEAEALAKVKSYKPYGWRRA